MPLTLDRNRTVPVWLTTDADKPEADRPTFMARFPTARQVLEVDRLTQEARAEKDQAKSMSLACRAVGVIVVGWKNMGEATFSEDALLDVLTAVEIWDLLYHAQTAVILAERDLKNSLSPQPSAAGNSAPVALDGQTKSTAVSE